MAYSQGDMDQMAEHAAKELRAQLEAVTKDRDTLQRSLNAVSAAIADAGSVGVPNDEERYSDAVRQITVQRDTACAAVRELEKKLAVAEALVAEDEEVMRRQLELDDKLRADLALRTTERDDWKQKALDANREAWERTQDRDRLTAELGAKATERDDWERACKNREDDLRTARHEAERYAAEAEAMKAERDTARREQFIAADHRETVLGITSRKLVAMTERAEKAERERDECRERKVLCEQLESDLAAAMKVVEAARFIRGYAHPVGEKQFECTRDLRELMADEVPHLKHLIETHLVPALDSFDARKDSGGLAAIAECAGQDEPPLTGRPPRQTSGSGESPASALGCNRANTPEAGDYDARKNSGGSAEEARPKDRSTETATEPAGDSPLSGVGDGTCHWGGCRRRAGHTGTHARSALDAQRLDDNSGSIGDFTALVKALRVAAHKADGAGSWAGGPALRILADVLEKGGGDGE